MSPQRHVAVRVPATTANLGPGFDAFGAAVARHLWVRSGPADEQRVTTTAAEGIGATALPTGDDNLLWRSLVAACEHLGQPVPDVSLTVRTAIPLERGLGSSSAAIVAGVVLARALTGAAVGEDELVAVAADIEGHPDNVAPALLGGLVVCAPTDDGPPAIRRALPAERLRPVALVPADRQSTAAARAVLPEHLSRDDAAAQAGRAGHVLGALLGTWPVEPAAAGDLLHEPPRLEAMTATRRLLDRLRGAGVHAWLSGAGPTVAAVVTGPAQLETCRRTAGDQRALHALGWDLAGAVACPEGGCAWSGGPDCLQCPRRAV